MAGAQNKERNIGIAESLQRYVAGCPAVVALKSRVHVDFTDARGKSAGIMPTGDLQLGCDFAGNGLVQYNFALFVRNCTASDVERLESSGFVEQFSDWLRECEISGALPYLGEHRIAQSVECSGGAMFDPAETSGLYLIQCHLIYERRRKNGDENP